MEKPQPFTIICWIVVFWEWIEKKKIEIVDEIVDGHLMKGEL